MEKEKKLKGADLVEAITPFFEEARKIPNKEIFEYFKGIFSKVDFDNIFKHDITYRESKRFYGTDSINFAYAVFKKTDELPWCTESVPDDRYYALGLLYSGRGDDKKAKEYWSKVESTSKLQLLWQDTPSPRKGKRIRQKKS